VKRIMDRVWVLCWEVLVREQWVSKGDTASQDTFLPDLMYASAGLEIFPRPATSSVTFFEGLNATHLKS
jgi:hypothetical protein